jgi:hypothetical protein
MQMIDMKQELMINQEVIYTQVEKEIVIMDVKDGAYHGLNPVAAELWMLLENKPMSPHAMAEYLQESYVVDQPAAVADVNAFLTAMLAQDFLMPSVT